MNVKEVKRFACAKLYVRAPLIDIKSTKVNSFQERTKQNHLEKARDEDLATRGNVLGKGLALDALLDHGPKNAQHSRASLVELHIKLELELLTLKGISEVAGSVVATVVRGRPSDKLHETGSEQDLG